MTVKTQWKWIIGIFTLLLFISVLERWGIPFELVMLYIALILLFLIIILPESFIKFLRKLMLISKKEEKRLGFWGVAWRVAIVWVVKRVHEAFWGKKA